MKKEKQVIIYIAFSLTLAVSAFADWSPPEAVTETNTQYTDKLPFISYDGKTLYFSRVNTDSFYFTRLYKATRENTYGPFTNIENISELNYSGGHVNCAWVSPDNLRMYYNRTESGSASRIKYTKRASVNDNWGPSVNLTEINALGKVYHPRLSSDELILVFGSDRLTGGVGGVDMWMATRPDTNSPFGSVRNLSELNSTDYDSYGFLSEDKLTIYFSSNREGYGRIYKATRTSVTDNFAPPSPMPEFDIVNMNSSGPCPSSDGTEFYFNANISGQTADIYVSYLIEPPNIVTLDIEGPNEVAEESAGQYRAIAVYDNNSTKDVTDQAIWVVEPDKHCEIDDTGLLTTDQLVMPYEDVTIYAQYTEASDTFNAQKDVTMYARCPGGNALDFDGKNDHVVIPDNQSQQIQTNQITLSAWILLNNDLVESQARIICKQENKNKAWGFELVRHDYGDSIGNRLFFHDSDGTTWYNCFSQTDLQLKQWYHVAVTDIAGVIKIYINGYLDTESDQGYGIPSNIVSNIYIGSSVYKGNSVYFLDAIIDEVMVFDRALAVTEIKELMHYGPNVDDPNLVGYWDFEEGAGQVAGDLSGNGNNGYLGIDPCNPDTADPCWILPGAPTVCSNEQMIKKNFDRALKDKQMAKDKIDAALEKERANLKLLARMYHSKDQQWSKWQIARSFMHIYHALQKENHCLYKLIDSMRDIIRAMGTLELESEMSLPKESHAPNSVRRRRRR